MGWYNSSWTHRQKITVDATKVDEVFSLLPIYTSNLNLDFFSRAKAGAADVRITQADGTTEVARYVVAHDATGHTGLILANVLADVSISTNTDYYVYYGNTGASDYATSATYGRDAVFAEYEGAYMPGMTLSDLTGAGRDLTAVNTPGTAASGYEGITAATYNGTTQYHKYEGTQAVTNWPITLEALASTDINTATRNVMALAHSTGTSLGRMQFVSTTANFRGRFTGASGSASDATSTGTYSTATMYYMAQSRDANTGTTRLYQNGAADGTNTTTIAAPDYNRFAIGGLLQGSLTSSLDGNVALALLSNSVRSADYIATMYDAWSTAGFFTAGAIETEDGVVTTTTSGAGLASRSTRTNDLGDGRWYKGAYWNVTMPDMTGYTVTGAELQLNLTGISGTGPTMSVYARAEADTGAWTSSSTHTTIDALSLGTAVLTGQVVSAGTGVKYFDITGDSGKGVLDFYADHPTGGDLTIALVDEGFSGTLTGASTELHVGNDDTSPTPGTVTFAIHSDATLWPRIAIAYTTGGGGGTNVGSFFWGR